MTFNELEQIPADVIPLPLEMEQKLARTLDNKRSPRKLRDNAIAMLVHYSMREAFLYAGRCGKGKLSADELTSLSYLGLCKAAKNFKPGQLRFFSYAKIYVRSEVFRQFRETSVVRNVEPGRIIALGMERSRDPGSPAIGDTNWKSTEVIEKGVITNRHAGVGSVGFKFDEINSAEIWSALLPRLRSLLTPKEYAVVTQHYIDDLNFREIGDNMGNSRSHAQNLHARALRKLQAARAALKTELDQ